MGDGAIGGDCRDRGRSTCCDCEKAVSGDFSDRRVRLGLEYRTPFQWFD